MRRYGGFLIDNMMLNANITMHSHKVIIKSGIKMKFKLPII